MKGVVLLLLLLLLAALVQGSPRTSLTVEAEAGQEGERRLCGRRLANELNRVCKGVYNKPTASPNVLSYRTGRAGKEETGEVWPVQKFDTWLQASYSEPKKVSRSTDKGEAWYFNWEPVKLSSLKGGRLALLSRAEASRLLDGRAREKRGLSAECCRKACSVSELTGYCY